MGSLCWETRIQYSLSEFMETWKVSNSMQAITKADQLEVKMFPMPEQCKVFTMWINEIVLLVFFLLLF